MIDKKPKDHPIPGPGDESRFRRIIKRPCPRTDIADVPVMDKGRCGPLYGFADGPPASPEQSFRETDLVDDSEVVSCVAVAEDSDDVLVQRNDASAHESKAPASGAINASNSPYVIPPVKGKHRLFALVTLLMVGLAIAALYLLQQLTLDVETEKPREDAVSLGALRSDVAAANIENESLRAELKQALADADSHVVPTESTERPRVNLAASTGVNRVRGLPGRITKISTEHPEYCSIELSESDRIAVGHYLLVCESRGTLTGYLRVMYVKGTEAVCWTDRFPISTSQSVVAPAFPIDRTEIAAVRTLQQIHGDRFAATINDDGAVFRVALAGNSVTDVDMRLAVSQLPALTTATLVDTYVTKAGLYYLRTLDQLQTIELAGTDIQSEDIAALRSRMPGVEIRVMPN